MRVHVYDPRGHDQPVGVDLGLGCLTVEVGERRHPAVADADVDPTARQAGPVDDEPAAHDEVEAGHAPAAANDAWPVRTTRKCSPSGPALKP